MRIGRNDPKQYHESKNCHHGAGTICYMGLLDNDDFKTNWSFIHRGILLPKGGIGNHAHDGFEEMYIIFDNAARFTHNGHTAELVGAVTVPCRMGESHGIYNHTDADTQFMNLGVAGPSGSYDCRDFEDDLINAEVGPEDNLPVGWLDKSILRYTGPAHGGKGEIGFREVWGHQAFKSNWGFIHHIVIPPGCSIGYHQHKTMEECYILLAGSGRSTVDDETEEVYAGDAIPCRLDSTHGLYNHTDEDMEVLNMAVCMEKGKFDSTDVGDDLSKR